MAEYIEVISTCGYVGCEDYSYFEIEDNMTEEELSQFSYEVAVEAMEPYSYIGANNIEPDDFETEEEYEDALEQIAEDFSLTVFGEWRYITKEEYDDYTK